ncbi:MAG: phosphate acyltransferase PlsX [Chloroflexi bacterium]|nr:phosphate acyltransferase PlsX [Chloroflexota bacterium]
MAIAVDAMGGDLGPAEVIKGALAATKEYGVETILVGRQPQIEQELARLDGVASTIAIVHADEVVQMHEHASSAVRTKRSSSIAVGLGLVREGRAGAFVSPGNTGAVMATALFTLGRIRGIERPALGIVLPTLRGKTLIVDIGANVDCKPSYLVQFAQMGAVYLNKVFNVSDPSIGLLSIGEEETKGNQLVLEAHELLKGSGLNFRGNVEGKDIAAGLTDVVVTDGFVGNVVIKSTEGIAHLISTIVQEELTRSVFSRLLALGLLPNLRRIKERLDYAGFGGATLLGVDGVCIIAHGRSNAKAIKNAIRVAKQAVQQDIVDAIKRGVVREVV